MNRFIPGHSLPSLRRIGSCFTVACFAATSLLAAEIGRSFATPEAAVAALADAVRTTNQNELHIIFGPAADELVNPDPVQAVNEFNAFAQAFNETNRLLQESPTRRTLEVGCGGWLFPVPIVERDGSWSFDTAAGKDELLNRRIGGNELETLQTVRAYVQAQREYASRDRDGDEVLQYAQKFISSPGMKDGLFWDPEADGELSPLGPLIADAADEGYKPGRQDPDSGPRPFHGYYFRILTRQGKHAPGGKYSYIINRRMIGGFALVAWPAEYRQSGIMTFIVNQQGRVYQKDLGQKTATVGSRMKNYDPDPTWLLSPN